jgi:hypothetical protein
MDDNADYVGTSMLLAMVSSSKCGSQFEQVGSFEKESNVNSNRMLI